jgi:hypothetical protein
MPQKNERIVLTNASIAASILLALNVFINAYFAIWDKVALVGIITIVCISIVANVGGYAFLYFIVDRIHRIIWCYGSNRCWNLKGIWYGIQTMPDDECYFRVAEIKIEQLYFSLHIVADTHNVKYDINEDALEIIALEQTTHWVDDSLIDIHRKTIEGIYVATRPNETLKGIHNFSVVVHKGRPSIIRGFFIDINKQDGGKPRQGDKYMFRNEKARHDEAVKLIKAIIEKHPELVDEQGFYNSQYNNQIT